MHQPSEIWIGLERYLKARFRERKALSVTSLEKLAGGISYLTCSFEIKWQEGRRQVSECLVLRMLPEVGHVPPYDIRPQYEAMKRVQGTGIPVPKMQWLEMDESVLGRPFFVMEKIEGESLMNAYRRDPGIRVQLQKEYVDCLKRIHELDWKALGLSVLGVPQNDLQYAENDLGRWEGLIRKNDYSPQPVLSEALVWLKRNIPKAGRTTLCHGDYYAHNVFCRDGHIVAIFDWELVGIGDPMNDIAWTPMFMEIYPGFWNEAGFVKAYEEASGMKLDDESYFFWKLLGYYRYAAFALASFKDGLEGEEFDPVKPAAQSSMMAVALDRIARMLKF